MSSAQSHRMKLSGIGWYLASMMQSMRVSLVRISILTSQDWWDLPSCWKHASPNEGGRRPWGNKCEYCLHTLVHTEAHRQDWVGKNFKKPTRECWNCGRRHEYYKRDLCPAYGKICNKCLKPNHFAARCWTTRCRNTLKQSDALEEEEEVFPTEAAVTTLDDLTVSWWTFIIGMKGLPWHENCDIFGQWWDKPSRSSYKERNHPFISCFQECFCRATSQGLLWSIW